MPPPTTNGATKRLHWSALPALSHKRSSPEPSGLKFTAVRTRVQSRLDSSSEPQVLQHLAVSTGGLLAISCWLLALAVSYWLLAHCFCRPRMGTDEHGFLSRSDFWFTRNTQKAQKGCIAMLATGRRKRRVVASRRLAQV